MREGETGGEISAGHGDETRDLWKGRVARGRPSGWEDSDSKVIPGPPSLLDQPARHCFPQTPFSGRSGHFHLEVHIPSVTCHPHAPTKMVDSRIGWPLLSSASPKTRAYAVCSVIIQHLSLSLLQISDTVSWLPKCFISSYIQAKGAQRNSESHAPFLVGRSFKSRSGRCSSIFQPLFAPEGESDAYSDEGRAGFPWTGKSPALWLRVQLRWNSGGCGQEATVRLGDGKTPWFLQAKVTGKGAFYIPILFNLYTGCILMENWVRLRERRSKIGGRYISNLRYAEDTILLTESSTS